MSIAFDPARSDFSRILPGVSGGFIGEVQHSASLCVDETGTEARGLDALSFSLGAGRPKPEVIADRPFLCAIVDERTGAILFMGAIVDPTPL